MEVHVYALAVFLVPLVLMRATQLGQIRASRESADRLREAAGTIHRQNVSLEEANRLLRNRSTEALEGLSATVDARRLYTAGHSRRVREIAQRIGEEIGLSHGELEMLAHAALFHDIGKIAVSTPRSPWPSATRRSERHSPSQAELRRGTWLPVTGFSLSPGYCLLGMTPRGVREPRRSRQVLQRRVALTARSGCDRTCTVRDHPPVR